MDTVRAIFSDTATIGVAAATGGAGAAAEGAAAGGIGGFFSGLNTIDYIVGGAGILSSLASISAGERQAAALTANAAFEDVRAQSELLKGRREALDAAEALNKVLGAQVVATAASGLTAEGSPGAAMDAAKRKAAFETDIIRSNAEINAAARRTSADQLRLEAEGARAQGYAGASNVLFQLGARYATAGRTPTLPGTRRPTLTYEN